ncbi:MAG: hypothetical protein MI923_09315 [Phycisphaerales bacterium]|nr:hypothetical protein [Phycisphaerales bacterium]
MKSYTTTRIHKKDRPVWPLAVLSLIVAAALLWCVFGLLRNEMELRQIKMDYPRWSPTAKMMRESKTMRRGIYWAACIGLFAFEGLILFLCQKRRLQNKRRRRPCVSCGSNLPSGMSGLCPECVERNHASAAQRTFSK